MTGVVDVLHLYNEKGERTIGKLGRRIPPLFHDNIMFAVIVTIHATNQLASVAILPASPLMLIGRICQFQAHLSFQKKI